MLRKAITQSFCCRDRTFKLKTVEMGKIIIFILIATWLVLAPSCNAANEDDPSNSGASSILASSDVIWMGGQQKMGMALDHKFLVINGEPMTPRQLYGGIVPTKYNLKWGKTVIDALFNHELIISQRPEFPRVMWAGEAYVERDLSLWSAKQTGPIVQSISTDVAMEISRFIDEPNSPMTLLIGDSNSGKSALLDMIYYKVRELKPHCWNIYVDVLEKFPHWLSFGQNLQSIAHTDLVNGFVNPECQELFYNLMEINPKRIVIFFDHIEKMSLHSERLISNAIKVLAGKGVTVVVGGGSKTLQCFQGEDAFPRVWKVNEMNFRETKEFIKNIWKTRMKVEVDLHTTTMHTVEQRLETYALTITSMLHRTTFIRLPTTVIFVARYFKQLTPSGCFNYVFSDPLEAASLDQIKNVRVPKKKLYDLFIIALFQSTEIADSLRDYEIVAMSQIVHELEGPKLAKYLLQGIEQEIATAENSLRRVTNFHRIFVNILPDGKIEFIHPDFRSYFATSFIVSENFLQLKSLMPIIYGNPRYQMLLEFLNSQAEVWVKDHIQLMLPNSNKKLKWEMLDNVLGYGHEELWNRFLREFLSQNKLDELKEYFSSSDFSKVNVKRTFGSIEPPTQDDIKASADLPVESPRTRVDYLIENDMMQSYKLLSSYKGKSVFGSVDYQRLFHIAVTNPSPNINFVKLLKSQADEASFKLNFDGPLYHMIDQVGEACLPIAELFVDYTIHPQDFRVNNKNLLHAAVKWNSPKLLQFVMETLKVTTIDADVIAIALDSNPSPLHTPTNWWAKMSYLMKHLDPSFSIDQLTKTTKNTFKITAEDCNSVWFKVIVGAQDSDQQMMDEPSTSSGSARKYPTFRKSDSNAQTMQLHAAELTDTLSEQLKALTEYIAPSTWRLSSETLALRRDVLMQHLRQRGSIISLTEVLVNYRGTGELSTTEREFYLKTIKGSLEREASLNQATRTRIFNTLVENIGSTDDLIDLQCIIHNGLLDRTYQETFPMLQSQLEKRLRSSEFGLMTDVDQLSVRERLLQTTQSRIRKIIDEESFQQEVTKLLMSFNDESHPPISMCLSRQTRRTAVNPSPCRYSWTDIDEFHDGSPVRVISDVRVNSEKYIRALAAAESRNKIKATQLIDFVVQLKKIVQSKELIRGDSTMFVRDVIKHGGIAAYRSYNRITNVISGFWQSTDPKSQAPLKLRLPSRTVIIHAAEKIPLIKGLLSTISVCLHVHGETTGDCLYASSALVVSASLPGVQYLSNKYLPWMIDHLSTVALDMIPAAAPSFLWKNIRMLQTLAKKFGSLFVNFGIVLTSVGFDAYNIYEMSKQIDMCRKSGTCISKDENEYIISLTFSCASVAITGGLLASEAGAGSIVVVSLILLLLEAIALGLNEVIYYNKNYNTYAGEGARIFLNKIVFRPLPSDVAALVRHKNWVDFMQNKLTDFLRDGHEDIVACGAGLGTWTTSGLVSGQSIINMTEMAVSNGQKLSRVLPVDKGDIMSICMPTHDNSQEYETYPSTVPRPLFKCTNSFVLVNKTRWAKVNANSTVIYDLQYIKRGIIVGSSVLNNMFLLYDSWHDLNVIGGVNTTDTYMLRANGFRGNITLKANSLKSILDLSHVTSRLLVFRWLFHYGMGIVVLGNQYHESFDISGENRTSPNLHVIGRPGQSDKFRCEWCTSTKCEMFDTGAISIDSRGGKSLAEMDQVSNCKFTFIRPFTRIVGSNFSKVSHLAYVDLDGSSTKDVYNESMYAVINPLESDFIIVFDTRSLLSNINNITFVPQTNELIWNLMYKPSPFPLILSIQPYHSTRLDPLTLRETIKLTSVFIDRHRNFTIQPVVTLPSDGISNVSITQFNGFSTVSSSRLDDVMVRNKFIRQDLDGPFSMVTRLIDPKTNLTFMFGSTQRDRFYIETGVVYLCGDDEQDIYTISEKSPSHVWINNKADDEIFDTLIISDEKCTSLHTQIGSREASECCSSSSDDVTLICSHMNITVQNFFKAPSYQHLQILWHNMIYVLIPFHNITWMVDHVGVVDRSAEFVQSFSFDEQWQSATTTLTGSESGIFINGSIDLFDLVAYRSGLTDVILAKRYLEHHSPSFIILKDFVGSDPIDGHVLKSQWDNFKIFMAKKQLHTRGLKNIQYYNAEKILTLIDAEDGNRMTSNKSNLLYEYSVDMSTMNEKKTLNFHHNKNWQYYDEDQLGVLIISGCSPYEFFGFKRGTDLILSAGSTDIIFRNWCNSARHRIYRMEFIDSIESEPVVIHNMDSIDCDVNFDLAEDEITSMHLSLLFMNASEEYFASNRSDNSDRSRLMHCLSSFLIDILLGPNSNGLYDISSTIEQMDFMRDNCNTLFTRMSFASVKLDAVKQSVENRLKKLQLKRLSSDEDISIALVRERLGRIDQYCWQSFLFFMNNITDKKGQDYLGYVRNFARSFASCIPGL